MKTKHERVHIRERRCKDGSKSLQLDYSYRGTRYRLTTGLFLTGDETHDRQVQKLAAEMRNQKENELLQIERGIIQPNYRGNVTSVRDFAIKIANTKNKKSSKRNYLGLAKRVPGDLMLADITRANFPDILASACPKKCSINTKRLYGTMFRAVLNRAQDDGYLEKSPNLKGAIPSSQKGNKEFLTEDELIRFQNVNDETLESTKQMFLFSVNTGLRISDIETLMWENIVDNSIVKHQVKTERQIRIPINDNAQRFMPPQKDSGPVFSYVPRNTLERRLKALCKKAGIKKHITFHCARVTCATQLLSRGTDVYTVSRILGHADIKTTSVYLRLVDGALKKAVDSLDNIGNPTNEMSFGDNIIDFKELLKLNENSNETQQIRQKQT